MNILINASNLSGGGGAQVCDSICRYLKDFPQHFFFVVLSSALDNTADAIKEYQNVKVIRYDCVAGDFKAFLSLRIPFLDNIVSKNNIDCVFTVFGPIKWRPRCPHICGFGLSHIVMPESPFFQRMNIIERIKWWKTTTVWKYIFHRSADSFITENPLVTERLQKIFPSKNVVTITNNYNQIFDNKDLWNNYELPFFDGFQLLDIATYGPHKNQCISLDIAKILKKEHPDFSFRFVFTMDEKDFPAIPDNLRDCFFFTGRVSIDQCPSLYQQCDAEFQPTLLECFTATYPEGMRLKKPIITTDLEFARRLCGDAALYYAPLSAQLAADTIYRLANDRYLQQCLITNGTRQLKSFDTSYQRATKIIRYMESTFLSSNDGL